MKLEKLMTDVLSVIEEFDRASAPFGLYAARDILLEPKPKMVIGDFLTLVQRRPDLEAVTPLIAQMSNITDWAKQNQTYFQLEDQDLGIVELKWVRTSKIKVRRYGSNYHLDKHENFAARWEQLNFSDQIAQLWKPSRVRYYEAPSNLKMLLFVGFDRAVRPFERELNALKSHQNHEAHGVCFTSRAWEDRFVRKFRVRAAVWARYHDAG